MKRWMWILACVAAAAVAVAAWLWLDTEGTGSHYDVDRRTFPVKGIDVSSHNKAIDFDSVAADSVSFVIIKATEGGGFCDPRFLSNYQRARKAGLRVGAYHFFRFDVPGATQAAHFLEALEGSTLDLPLMIDVEDSYNVDGVAAKTVRLELQAMVDAITAAGYPVGVYTNRKGRSRYGIANDNLWLCTFRGEPSGQWRLWQHSHHGRVAGIEDEVDLDTFNGSAEAFDQWCESTRFTIKR